MSILSAVNPVNRVKTVNAVKSLPPPGGVVLLRAQRPPKADAWVLDGIDKIDCVDGIDCGRC